MALPLSLSTSYFAGRHLPPEEMAAEARELGFGAVELGYFTRETQLAAWERALAAEGLAVTSLHAFCPMAVGMPQLGPEIFALAALGEELFGMASLVVLYNAVCGIENI